MQADDERRRDYRLNKVLGAMLGSQKVRIFVINISLSGLKATYQQRLPEDGAQSLQLFLNARESPLEIQAEIAWQRELVLSGMFEVGFRFLQMSEADEQRLETFMKSEVRRDESKPASLSLPWKFEPG